MKRLIQSSKFWLAVLGAISTVITFRLCDGDSSLAMFVGGLFGAGIVGNATEDIMKNNQRKT